MYLRQTTRVHRGKGYTYWRLVRSVRQGKKVRQETVAHLGELDAQGRANARALARHFVGRSEQLELLEREPAAERVAVRVDQIRLERGRAFGDVWMGWTLWRALALDEICDRVMPHDGAAVPWSTIAAVLAIARLCAPSSELHIAEDWYRKTALEDLLNLPVEWVNETRLYRAHDHLLPSKGAIEAHVRARLGELFELDYDLLLYDVTSTYFEGLANGNVLAKRGHSRDHRPDCKQVCIALVVTREGMPLGFEVFEGNRTDVTTVETIVSTMEQRHGVAKRIWVMDRGMTSEENIAWLREQPGRRYLIGTPKSDLKKWRAAISEKKNWREVHDGLEVKLCKGPDGDETFVLCRSADRREKERAMHARFRTRIEEGLRTLTARIEKSHKALDRGVIERQIGRLLQRNSRAAGRYDVRVHNDASRPAGVRVVWKAHPEWDEWAAASEGCYILRTNIADWKPDDLWKTYVQLSEAEAAFRIQKSDLSIRPVWHHRADRVQAHIMVCFLAYVMWKTLERWMERAGIGNSPRALLDELRAIRSTDVVLLTDERVPRELRIRCVVRPEKPAQVLLDRLGIRLPDRLRIRVPGAEM
jgi:transposase